MRFRSMLSALLPCFCTVLFVGISLAQDSRATVEGRVLDIHGAAIPNAAIVVTSQQTGITQKMASNREGLWRVGFLNPGTYDFVITAPGFAAVRHKGITLEVADNKRIDTTMKVGATTEVISVTSEAPLVDTSSATSGTVIEQATIAELPIESRIPYLLAGLSPGVHMKLQNNNVAYMWSNNASSQIFVNGGRDNRSNEFLLDGMPNQTQDKVAYIPPADSVAEFRVMTNAYDAQYGRQAGGSFNVALKSGSEKYHGSLYEYHQNSFLNANRYEFNNASPAIPKPVAHYNLYGGTFGGPALFDRKRTFFFTTWEGIRNKDPRNNAPLSLPTDAERNGDFSKSFTTTVTNGVRSAPIPINIYDPATLSGSTRLQFQCNGVLNVICPDRISPVAKAILQYVPLPNNPSDGTSNNSGDYVPNAYRQNKMASLVVRVDHTFNDRHKAFMTVRWNHEDEDSSNLFHNVATGLMQTRINKGAGVDYVWALSGARILNLRYNITRFEEPHRSDGADFDPAKLGFPQSFVDKMEKKSFPQISGVFSNKVGDGWGDYTDTTYHTWLASVTESHGKMMWHYGGDYRVIQEATGDYGNQSGAFRFTGDWTRRIYNTTSGPGDGNAIASFLLGDLSGGASGQPSEFNRNANRFDSQHIYSAFFQNDWRIASRLTLNMGLRWDYETPVTERFDRFTSVFDPTQLNPISNAAQAAYTNILNTMLANTDPRVHSAAITLAQLVPASSYQVYGVQLFPGVNGQKHTVTNGDFSKWQPRAGFAYQLFKSTVIRGGVGRFVQGTFVKGGQNGFSRTTSVISSTDNGKTPYDTLDNPFRNGILEPTGSSLGPLTNLGQGVSWVNQDPLRPYSWQYSFQIQQALKNWIFEAGYSHQDTFNIQSSPGNLEQNDIGLDSWITYQTPIFDATGQPQYGPGGIDIGSYHLGNNFLSTRIPNPFRNLSTDGTPCNVTPLPATCVSGSRGTSSQISVYDLMRPLKLLGSQNMSNNPTGKTHYDALELRVQKRFSGGYSVLGAYTYSKLIEITSFLGPQLAGVQEHKIGGEDTPHKISVASIYELPIGRKRRLLANLPRALDAVIGGWEITGQYTLESGPPVVFSNDSFFDSKDPALHDTSPTLSQWFDTSHFVRFPRSGDDISQWPAWTGVQNLPGGSNCQPTGTAKNCVYADFANFIRTFPTRWSDVRGSRTNEMNFGIYKNFRLSESWKAQLRGQAFNVFNHPRFGLPNSDPGNSQFGVVAPAQQNEPRVIQVALKITF